MKIRDFAKIYFALLVLQLAVIYQPESQALFYISKPALLFSLLAFFIHRTNPTAGRLPFALALGASLLGDVLLMFSGEGYFLAGMLAFGLAHIFFAAGFFSFSLRAGLKMLWLAGLIPLAGIFLLYYYVELPPDMAVYLYGYALLLSLSFVLALLFAAARGGHAWWTAVGALLFVTSDLMLAYNRYNDPAAEKYWHMAVIGSYALAQFLIVRGVLPAFIARAEAVDRANA